MKINFFDSKTVSSKAKNWEKIDTFEQIEILKLTENTSFENLDNMNSTTGLLNGIGCKIERLAQSINFVEIINHVVLNDCRV